MISILAASLRRRTLFDNTLENLRSGLDEGPIILDQAVNDFAYIWYKLCTAPFLQ